MRVIVDSTSRRQGIGTALYQQGLAFVREQGAMQVLSDVRSSCAECLLFALRHGFSIERYTIFSKLYLAKFDETPFSGVIEAVESSGISLRSLADLGNTLENQQRVYEMNRRFNADDPAHATWGFEDFETFRKRIFEASEYRADGQIIALDGEHWVGMASANYNKHDNSLYNRFTGVEQAYRGRRIALALKLFVIRYAQKNGITSIFTNNDSENAPMLAINNKLGYHYEAGVYRLRQSL